LTAVDNRRGVRPLMTASGGVSFEDEYRYVIATS
jgi:hypothetical protein